LSLFCASIKLSARAFQWFGHLTLGLSTISGLGGEIEPDIGLIDPRMDRPVQPLWFRRCKAQQLGNAEWTYAIEANARAEVQRGIGIRSTEGSQA
jgi:hypothetical protein